MTGTRLDSDENRRPSQPRKFSVPLVLAGALIVGGLIGGLAGAAISNTVASQELSEVAAALNESKSKLDDAERQLVELGSENDSLEDELSELSNQEDAAESESEASQPAVPSANFPEGYPYVVQVSELPAQVKNWYEMGSITEAVALAPGVWTELPPGADMESAIAAGIADGFCASIEAYERDYAKMDLAGTCW